MDPQGSPVATGGTLTFANGIQNKAFGVTVLSDDSTVTVNNAAPANQFQLGMLAAGIGGAGGGGVPAAQVQAAMQLEVHPLQLAQAQTMAAPVGRSRR